MFNKPDASPGSENAQGNATVSRRVFMGAGAAAAALARQPATGANVAAPGPVVPYDSHTRMEGSYSFRTSMARSERVDAGVQASNGDAARFTDYSGSFTKTLLHDGLGVPNKAAVQSLIKALQTGCASDFENILIGTPGGGPNSKENGPQGALALDLQGLDSHATVIPPAPSVASAQTAAEAVEHYWGALLRDVPFTDYATNTLAAQAVADMNRMSFLRSTTNQQWPYPVTPQSLFRGQFVTGDGNARGPYISQFMLQPTSMGAQPLDQRYRTFLPVGGGGSDFMTSVSEFQLIQNGGSSGRVAPFDPILRYIRSGRDLAAYTNVDALFQAYFVASLVLLGINAPANPGIPYNSSRTQKAFGTLGAPDAVGTLAQMSTCALKAAWFHKWMKDLRLRPEEYGGLVQARLGGSWMMPQAAAALHSDLLTSPVIPMIQAKYGSHLLPQAFPEGSPTHPCYPTGHGTVGGACITALKFFFDGSQKLRPLLRAAGTDVVVPSSDGLSLNTYTGADRDALDINGELTKLAFNISFGHGIHAGIHFRSSTHQAILLGEQVALSVLQDRAACYNEPFQITITKFDGTLATITNTGPSNGGGSSWS
jgi:hypothetical protein